MDALGITLEEVESTIKKGMKWREEDKWHANYAGIETVFHKEENEIFVITVYTNLETK